MINVIGLGYIGLPTALMLAANGNDVVGTDINSKTVGELGAGHVTFKENGLDELFDKAVNNGIRFSAECCDADIYIIAVPTPYNKDNKKIDAKAVCGAVEDVLKVCRDNAVIVIESTIAPGTVEHFIRPIVRGRKVHLAHAPERIIPGNMLYELQHNSRTIGADDCKIGEKIKDVYASFCKGEIVVTDIKTAEMSKVVENTYRDINIAFANELAKICRNGNMDVYKIINIANRHPRVNILQPGPGVGGHCISVDPWFLVGDYPGLANIILAARKINDSMPEFVLKRAREIMDENGITDIKRVGLYGLTYKENVDDTRESPTLQLLECMRAHLAGSIKVYDPFVKNDIVDNQYHDPGEFFNDTDMVIVMVAHDEILKNRHFLDGKVVFDTRNAFKEKDYYKL